MYIILITAIYILLVQLSQLGQSYKSGATMRNKMGSYTENIKSE